jgi:hypothetical protein
MAYNSVSITATGAANGASTPTSQNPQYGPDGTAAVAVSGAFVGCTLVVEGKLPGNSSAWFPLGGTNVRTGEPVNGGGIVLTDNTAAAFRFPGVDLCANVRAYLSAFGSGTVLAEINTQPAAFGSNVVVPLTNSIASTPQAITSSSANALAVGPNGTTNPVLQVDASTGSAATGLKVTGAAAAGGVALAVISSGTNEALTINAKGSGTISIGNSSTGAITLARATGVTGALTGTAASAIALAVGANGATNPVLQVDSSTGSVATGVKVTGAAAAGGVAIAAISSGTNENLTVDAKGSGTITLNGTGTGVVTTPRTYTAQSGQATTAGGGAAALLMGAGAFGVYFGSGAPTISAAQGSLYIRSDGSSTSTRLYVNSNGTTGWTSVTTAA